MHFADIEKKNNIFLLEVLFEDVATSKDYYCRSKMGNCLLKKNISLGSTTREKYIYIQ